MILRENPYEYTREARPAKRKPRPAKESKPKAP